MKKIINTLLAPYHFLTSPATYEAAQGADDWAEPQDVTINAAILEAKFQLLNKDLPLIVVEPATYAYLKERLPEQPGPLAVLGVPVQPTNWVDTTPKPGRMWVTRQGESVHVTYMGNTHLKHTVAFLERTGYTSSDRYYWVRKELDRRVKQGLDARPIQQYERVESINQDEVGDNLKTQGYRKAKFAAR